MADVRRDKDGEVSTNRAAHKGSVSRANYTWVQALSVPMVIVDLEGHLLISNMAFSELLKINIINALEQCVFNLIHYEDKTLVSSALQTIEDVGHCTIKHRFLRPDNTLLWVKTTIDLLNEDEDVAVLSLAFQDITDEVEILNSAEILLTSASVGIWDWKNMTSDTEHWSPRFYELLGYKDQEISSTLANFKWLLHPDDQARTFALVEAHMKGEADFDIEYRLRHKSGEYRWFRGLGQIQRDENGTPVRMVGSIQDIHEQHLAKKALERLSVRHKLSLQASNIGIWDWDIVNNHIVWDAQMYKLYGIRSEDWGSAYEAWLASVHPEDQESGQKETEAVLSGQKDFDMEFRVVWPSGQVRHIRSIAQTIRDSEEQPVRLVGVNWDVTSERAKTEALEQATADLQNANKALSRSNFDLQQFAYVASHDLQTPLRNVAGFAHLLMKKSSHKFDQTEQDYAARIVRGCKQMQTLIQDMLDYSRVESKAKPFMDVDLNEVLYTAKDFLKESIESSGAEIRSASRLPIVMADFSQMLQLFQNIISNGLKYNQSARPTIEVGHEVVADGNKVWFKDNGIGIPERHFKRIFNLFSRLHNSSQYPGTGLGLAVCQRVVDRHSATILVESTEGEGSVFSVIFEHKRNEPAPL